MAVKPRGIPIAHCGHLDDNGKPVSSRAGEHAPHVWFDVTSVDDRWCDGTAKVRARCACGYRDECGIWCGSGHETGACPPNPNDEITIDSFHAAQRWINVLHRRSIQDAETLTRLQARLRRLEAPWWRRWRMGRS